MDAAAHPRLSWSPRLGWREHRFRCADEGRSRLLVRTLERDGEYRLWLTHEGNRVVRPEDVRLRFRAVMPAQFEMECSLGEGPWGLYGAVARHRRSEGLCLAAQWAAQRLCDSAAEIEPAWPPSATLESDRLFEVLGELGRAAASACDPAARSAAMKFDLPLRLEVYRAIRFDGSGRLLQLAQTAPGALAFAVSIASAADPDARAVGRAALDAAIAGQKLKAVIRAAVEGIAALADRPPREGAERFPPLAWRPAFQDFSGRSAEERERVAEAHALLLRQAPAAAPAHALIPPCLEAFHPSSLPRDPRGRTRFFAVLSALRQVERLGAMDRGRRAELENLALERSVPLWEHAAAQGPLDSFLESLVDFVEARGRVPTRSMTWGAIAEQVREVQAELEEIRRRGKKLPRLRDTYPAPADPALAIEPIETSVRLWDEGRTMHHCVGSYVPQALSQRCFFFHADYGPGEPITIEVRREGGALRLGQVRGIANRDPSAAARAAIDAWWQQLLAA